MDKYSQFTFLILWLIIQQYKIALFVTPVIL